jgi:hypothetical protein
LNVFAQSKVTKEEYAIYTTVLKSIYVDYLKENKTKLSFVIIDTTYQPDVFSEKKADKISGLLNNFKQRNQVSTKLDKSFPMKYRYEITNKSEIDNLLEIGRKEFNESQKKSKTPLPETSVEKWSPFHKKYLEEKWKPFHKKYLDSFGYYELSRVGFSFNKEFALVYVEFTASEGGSSMNYILSKKKGNWTIYHSYGSGWNA